MIRDAFLVKEKIQLWLSQDPEVLDVEGDPDTGDLIVTFQPSDQPRKVRISAKAEAKDA